MNFTFKQRLTTRLFLWQICSLYVGSTRIMCFKLQQCHFSNMHGYLEPMESSKKCIQFAWCQLLFMRLTSEHSAIFEHWTLQFCVKNCSSLVKCDPLYSLRTMRCMWINYCRCDIGYQYWNLQHTIWQSQLSTVNKALHYCTFLPC